MTTTDPQLDPADWLQDLIPPFLDAPMSEGD
jgi:hypothetical protein